MDTLRRLRGGILGPSLYKKYGGEGSQRVYEANKMEHLSDKGIKLMDLLLSLVMYSSPFTALYAYRKGYELMTMMKSIVFVAKAIGLYHVIKQPMKVIRGMSRLNNPEYQEFYDILQAAQNDVTDKNLKKKLKMYDFDFSAWPVDYTVSSKEEAKEFRGGTRSARTSSLKSIVTIPCRLFSYVAANYLALKMIYPGSVRLLQQMLFSQLLQGRSKLIEDYGAERFKVRTFDKNDIDVIFIDRREDSKTPNGGTLVVCCEGNCGFYEIGCMMTAVEGKYSVLGWNHPGFGGSTGHPLPDQERNAIDAVMQFALNELEFHPSEILLYGWSIGGYTSSWAAMSYPDVKGLVLDATFDDLLPLALARMGRLLEPLIRRIVRDHVNLNVYENVSKYPGPVTFIRRSDDEMICTEEGNPATNRGNHLVLKVLKGRYPKLFDEKGQALLEKWLTSSTLDRKLIRDKNFVDVASCKSLIASYIKDQSVSYPMDIGDDLGKEQRGELIVFLAEIYMKEYRSTHCTPLPVSLFREPWNPAITEPDFVKV